MRPLTILGAALLLAACRSDSPESNADTALLRDLALAAGPAPSATFGDTAPSMKARQPTAREPRRTPPTPARTPARAPAPPPTPPEPSPATTPASAVTEPEDSRALSAGLRAGTALSLSLTGEVCSGSVKPGDKFIATIPQSVTGVGGFVVPAGSRAVIEVARVTGESPENATIVFRLRTIAIGGTSWPASAEAVPTVPPQRTAVAEGSDRKKVIGGAIAGAILGQVLGKDTKSTVIGAAAGAAAGTAAASASRSWQACFAAGTPLTALLADDVVVRS